MPGLTGARHWSERHKAQQHVQNIASAIQIQTHANCVMRKLKSHHSTTFKRTLGRKKIDLHYEGEPSACASTPPKTNCSWNHWRWCGDVCQWTSCGGWDLCEKFSRWDSFSCLVFRKVVYIHSPACSYISGIQEDVVVEKPTSSCEVTNKEGALDSVYASCSWPRKYIGNIARSRATCASEK